jgi:hypothetical protein
MASPGRSLPPLEGLGIVLLYPGAGVIGMAEIILCSDMALPCGLGIPIGTLFEILIYPLAFTEKYADPELTLRITLEGQYHPDIKGLAIVPRRVEPVRVTSPVIGLLSECTGQHPQAQKNTDQIVMKPLAGWKKAVSRGVG